MLTVLGSLATDLSFTVEGFHTFLAGFLGGGILGFIHFMRSLAQAKGEKLLQHFVAASLIGIVYAFLGGIVATYLQGNAGSFVTGLTAIGLVVAVAGNYLLKEEG